VARLAGFEPTTPWFVAKYSIQLSYSRTQKRNYNGGYRKREGLSLEMSGRSGRDMRASW
jgi:hypothetical protein